MATETPRVSLAKHSSKGESKGTSLDVSGVLWAVDGVP